MKTRVLMALILVLLTAVSCAGSSPIHAQQAEITAFADGIFAPCDSFRSETNVTELTTWYAPGGPPMAGQSLWYYRAGQLGLVISHAPHKANRKFFQRAYDLCYWVAWAEGDSALCPDRNHPTALSPQEALDLMWLTDRLSAIENKEVRP